MEIHPVLSLIVGLVALFITGFGLWYKIDRDTNAKIDSMGKLFAEQLAEAVKLGDEKRGRIYERLDTVKTAHREEIDVFRKEVYDSFVAVKWCTLIHTNADKTYSDLKQTIEAIKKDFQEALKALGVKIDTLLEKG